MRKIAKLSTLFLVSVFVSGLLRADDKKCERLKKELNEALEKEGAAVTKKDEPARQHWAVEVSKSYKRYQDCKCQQLKEEKEAALDKAQNSATASERETWAKEFQRLGRELKTCEEEKDHFGYGPCLSEELTWALSAEKKKKSPEEEKQHKELLKEMCSCLKKNGEPLPKECDEVTATLFPGDASVCDSLKKDYEEKQKALQKAGNLKPAEIRKVNEAANEAREKYCQCLVRMKVTPLPEDCQGVKLTVPSGPTGPAKVEPPPKTSTAPPPTDNSPKVSPVPPVPKAPPPPLPPPKTVVPPPSTPPPPPPSNTSAPPPASPVLISSCNTAPCPCKQQTPQKKCTAVACTGCQK